MEATKIIQVVLVILALALIGGAAAGLLGVFDDDGGSSSGGGGGSSNTETTAPDDTAVTETYVASDGDPTCSHTMDDGKVVTAATCGAEGTKVFTCTKCGYTEKEKISKTNEHTLTDDYASSNMSYEDDRKIIDEIGELTHIRREALAIKDY